MGKYDALTKEELVRLVEARDRREATRFGLVWEAGVEPEATLNADYFALGHWAFNGPAQSYIRNGHNSEGEDAQFKPETISHTGNN